jgi:hypothetical protein
MSSQNDQNTASPSPPPSPPPRVRPIDKSSPSPPTLKKVEKHSPSPPPPSVDIKSLAKGLSSFEWAELNRATEILRFFDDALIPFIQRYVDARVIAMLRIALATRLSEIVLRKYQMISTSFNLETAIDIIDEQLPKLLKTSANTINAEDIIKTWNALKDIIRGGKK